MRESGKQVLRFTHIHLRNWRNFTKAEVDLGRRAFLVGPNASGKSNFFDALRFLHDLVRTGGGFQEAVRKRGGLQKLRCLAARQYSDLSVTVGIGADENALEWEYELQFNQQGPTRPAIERERITKLGMDLVVRPDQNDAADPERLARTYLELDNEHKEFREVAVFLRSLRYLHLLPQLVREPDRSAGRTGDPFGGDLLEQIAATPAKRRSARLRHILDALRVAVPRLTGMEMRTDRRGRPHLRVRYEHWRPRGAWQTEDQLSDGTLRLIGLLWTTLNGVGPLLLEEPEMSLHSEVVRLLPGVLARLQRRTGRQLIVSTHSADLLCDAGIDTGGIVLLIPGDEGTSVRAALGPGEVRTLLESSSSLGEPAAQEAVPAEARQMTLFDE